MSRSKRQAHYPLEILNDIASILSELSSLAVEHVPPGKSQPQLQAARLQLPAEEDESSAAVSPKLVFSIILIIPCFYYSIRAAPATSRG